MNIIEVEPKEKNWTCYIVSNIISQKYTFKIINNGLKSGKIIFIDISKEINTNLHKFIYLNFSTPYINNNPLLPLIFNIEIFEDQIFNYKETKSKNDYIYNDEKYILSYCIINENENNDNFKI